MSPTRISDIADPARRVRVAATEIATRKAVIDELAKIRDAGIREMLAVDPTTGARRYRPAEVARTAKVTRAAIAKKMRKMGLLDDEAASA